MKKKAVAFTIADKSNLPYAKLLMNSFKKFHPTIPFIVYSDTDIQQARDPQLLYRATPYFAKELIKEYELVLKLDADQIITGSLNYIFDSHEYDVGCVLNWNREDEKIYGAVTIWDIPPQFYMNCGLVAMRNEEFIQHWWSLCNSVHFDSYQYREQDLLNILYYYGNYKTTCFDIPDRLTGYSAWHGLRSKADWLQIKKQGDVLVLEKSKNVDSDKEIKVLHWAGGNSAGKMNYRLYFKEDVITYLDALVADTQKDGKTFSNSSEAST